MKMRNGFVLTRGDGRMKNGKDRPFSQPPTHLPSHHITQPFSPSPHIPSHYTTMTGRLAAGLGPLARHAQGRPAPRLLLLPGTCVYVYKSRGGGEVERKQSFASYHITSTPLSHSHQPHNHQLHNIASDKSYRPPWPPASARGSGSAC